MFETTNSIEPASPQRARPKDQPIREATRAEMRRHAQVEDKSVKFGNWFQRTPKPAVEPDNVSRTHGLYVAQKRDTRTYYADFQQKSEVMRAEPAKISTKLSDRQTVTAMLDLAQSRGWDKVKLRGTEEFKAEAWVQAQVRGIATEGYKASDTDTQEVARRKQAAGPAEVVVGAVKKVNIAAASAPPQIAKGWTEAEAKQMDAHISAKVGRETVRSEPSAAATRLAERQADPTDRMHDKGRETQANAHKPAAKAKRNEVSSDVWGNADKLGAKMRAAEVSKQSAAEKSKSAVIA